MTMLFKTLVFSFENERTALGEFVHFINDSDLGGGEVPQLMKHEVTMEQLIKAYPKQELWGVKLVEVKLEIMPF